MTASQVRATVRVRVPATAANLGPGFDCFGLALTRYDEIEARLADRVVVTTTGVGAGEVPSDERHLVVRAVLRAWAAVGRRPPGLQLVCRNVIPHGGGQGSSAAAIVSGLLAGRALLPDPAELTDTDLLDLANQMEGHPDNVAPALSGGFTLAWLDRAGRARSVRRDVHPGIRTVLFTAAGSSSTHATRGLLPQQVPHRDAAANSAAAALLVHAMTCAPEYLLEATVDRLHQPYRAAAMPDSAILMRDLRDAGVAAVISGAGPSVLALSSEPIDLARFARPAFTPTEVHIDRSGAQVELGSEMRSGPDNTM